MTAAREILEGFLAGRANRSTFRCDDAKELKDALVREVRERRMYGSITVSRIEDSELGSCVVLDRVDVMRSHDMRDNRSDAADGVVYGNIWGFSSGKVQQPGPSRRKPLGPVRTCREDGHKVYNPYNVVKVRNIDTGEVYESFADAGRKIGYSSSTIRRVANGARSSTGLRLELIDGREGYGQQ